MGLLFFYLFLALSISFLCSIFESVLLSAPLTSLKTAKDTGSKGATALLKLKQNVDKPLSAILSLNTIAHTVGAAGVGAQATKVFGEAYFGLVSAILTILILVVTEIIPKTIGASYWKELTGFAAKGIQIMVFITYPIVLISAYLTKLFSKKESEKTISREEISALANIGLEEGIIEEKENKILQNIMKLKNIRASQIMTPSIVVSIADENMTLADFIHDKEFICFSRIPVFSQKEDNIVGYVFRQSVFDLPAEDLEKLTLKDIKRNILIVPETIPIFNVFELLLEKKEHIVLLVNEYGGMEGVVSLEDIIETLLGVEIIDEKDTITDMQQYARERWKAKQLKYGIDE